MKKKFKFPLAYQILVGAVFFGNPAVKKYLQPISDLFINMIKMIVVPIIVSTLILGVAGTGDMKQLGKLGGKTLIYFEVVTTIAILVGLGTVGIPLEGLAFIAGIDRLLDMARTVVNVVGNALATVVMSKWEGRFDKTKEEEYFVVNEKLA